jgi:hypothetical protein
MLDGFSVVRSCATAFEAEVLAARLRSTGIAATVDAEQAAGPYGRRGARVVVREEDLDEARAEVGEDEVSESPPPRSTAELWVAVAVGLVALLVVSLVLVVVLSFS